MHAHTYSHHQASTKSDLERTELQKDKTGLFTGSYVKNPVTGKPIPIWVADYVLASYGTGIKTYIYGRVCVFMYGLLIMCLHRTALVLKHTCMYVCVFSCMG